MGNGHREPGIARLFLFRQRMPGGDLLITYVDAADSPAVEGAELIFSAASLMTV